MSINDIKITILGIVILGILFEATVVRIRKYRKFGGDVSGNIVKYFLTLSLVADSIADYELVTFKAWINCVRAEEYESQVPSALSEDGKRLCSNKEDQLSQATRLRLSSGSGLAESRRGEQNSLDGIVDIAPFIWEILLVIGSEAYVHTFSSGSTATPHRFPFHDLTTKFIVS
ncbi:hypothetical protein L209DRAFT_775773 [Thermothelomyces heterothallicus CBS 203.75]